MSDDLSNLIENIAHKIDLSGNPGFIRYEDGSFEVLHADWPIYPAGHGLESSLESLGFFPEGTIFEMIDEIDRCYLFVVKGEKPIKNLWDKNNFYVALWHADILDLYENRMIEGVSYPLDYEELSLNPVRLNDIELTRNGYNSLKEFDISTSNDLDSELMDLINPFITISRYDTAIREVNILVETKIKGIIGSNSYGIKLIDSYYDLLSKRYGKSPSWLKIHRSELRAIFKFIRNEYAHNFKEINSREFYAVMRRVSSIYRSIKYIEEIDKTRESIAGETG